MYLLHLVDTSDDYSDPDVDGLSNNPELVGNLDGQLSCGCQDQSVNAVGVDTQRLNDGQSKSQRLA